MEQRKQHAHIPVIQNISISLWIFKGNKRNTIEVVQCVRHTIMVKEWNKNALTLAWVDNTIPFLLDFVSPCEYGCLTRKINETLTEWASLVRKQSSDFYVFFFALVCNIGHLLWARTCSHLCTHVWCFLTIIRSGENKENKGLSVKGHDIVSTITASSSFSFFIYFLLLNNPTTDGDYKNDRSFQDDAHVCASPTNPSFLCSLLFCWKKN